MKFIHTSDIHYGASPDANRPWGKERARALTETFRQIIETCRREKVDLLIISGGLFDGHPTDESVRELNTLFASVPGTKIYVIAGEDDGVFTTSPVVTFRWAENVTYNTDTKFTSTYYEGLQTEVIGASDDKPGFDPMRLADANPEHPGASILVFSASEIAEESIPNFFTYVALGGSHKPYVKRGGRLVNSGSPEPLGADDTGKHGYYLGEIDCERKKMTALKFVTLPTVRYITLSVNVTPVSTREDVLNNLRREMSGMGGTNIYRIRLNGLTNPEVSLDIDELKYEFRIGRIDDFTKPDYDYVKLFREHPADMVGFFVKEMNREDITELDKKAMNYGINALLKTADERN
ncbi:MAG: metallophosphoesterase [Lachnospiraceae bacterium]|nr:metallophosphoesterase [Lachnospiraceae bacterium]